MDFRILGPVEAHGAHGTAELGSGRVRALLAVLILHANRTVSYEQLAAAMWGDDRSVASAGPLHTYVSRLRRALDAIEPDGGTRIVTRDKGYQLEAVPGEVDVDRFRTYVEQARVAVVTGEPEKALARFRAALDLWRAPDTRSHALDEMYLSAVEEYTELRLQLGATSELIPELNGLIAAHPLRERPREQLMLVLYRVGRQTEALAIYQTTYRMLRDELGIEPGPALRELHRRILTSDEGLRAESPDASKWVPRQLPLDVAHFTGRQHHLDLLDAALHNRPSLTAICTIEGVAGVGKTGLALHWARSVAADLPDGQLYVNLRGHAQVPPTDPAEALARFLRALGVAEKQIPMDDDERAAAYRSLVADRRMLVLLDNAASAEQVRPLLPGTASCLVLVTSRSDLRGLTALEGAQRIVLDVLDEDEARTLLHRTVGEERAQAEPDAVNRLVKLCGRLPLALRIAAGHLVRYPRQRIADYVTQLAGGDRLTRLSIPDDRQAAVRASFDLSYRKLTSGPARLFRLLGLAPTPDITPHAAAALGELPVDEATDLLDQLSAGHLVESSTADRFQLHDLLRLYAAERAEQEDDCAAAVRRLHAFYLRAVDGAGVQVYPDRASLLDEASRAAEPPLPFTERTGALAWMDAERAGVLSVVRHANEIGDYQTCWLLAHAAGAYYYRQMNITDWRETAQLGLVAAQRAGDTRGRIAMVSSLANLHFTRGDYVRALDYGEQALQLVSEDGGHPGEAEIVRMHGTACWLSGRLDDAMRHFNRGVELYQRDGNMAGEAHAHIGLAATHEDQGRVSDALREAAITLDLGKRGGSPVSAGLALHCIASYLCTLGRFTEALDQLAEAQAHYQVANAVYHQPFWHYTSATIHRSLGEYDKAKADAERSLELARMIGERRSEAHARNALGIIATLTGHFEDAIAHHEAARNLAAQLPLRRAEIEAQIGLAAALPAVGRPQEALLAGEAALASAREHGYQLAQASALLALAELQPSQAADLASQAAEIHRRAGNSYGESLALRVIADAGP